MMMLVDDEDDDDEEDDLNNDENEDDNNDHGSDSGDAMMMMMMMMMNKMMMMMMMMMMMNKMMMMMMMMMMITFCSTALQTNSSLSGVMSSGRSNGVPMSSPSSLLNCARIRPPSLLRMKIKDNNSLHEPELSREGMPFYPWSFMKFRYSEILIRRIYLTEHTVLGNKLHRIVQ